MKISFFQGIVTGIFVFGALIGIFIFATYDGKSSGGVQIGPVSVWGTLPAGVMGPMLLEIGKTNASIKNVTYTEVNAKTLPSDLAAAIAIGKSPDMVLASQEQLVTLSPFLTPIPNESLPESAFTNSFIDGANILKHPAGTGYYGMPFLVDPLILYANSDVLASNGIARPPATWESLTGLVPKLAIITPSKQITRGLIGLGSYGNVQNARGILSSLFLQTRVPLVTIEASGQTQVELGRGATSNGPPAGEAVLAFYTQFADPAKLSYTWNGSLPNSQQAFATGALVLYIGYSSEAKVFAALNPNLNITVAPLPQPSNAPTKATYGLLYSFMITRAARNQSGAYQAAALLTNTTEQRMAAEMSGLAPVSRTLLTTPPQDLFANVAYSSALYAKGWLSPAPADVDKVFSGMITNVTSGRFGLGEAISRATAEFRLLFR